mgnify:CR=1 FL=1
MIQGRGLLLEWRVLFDDCRIDLILVLYLHALVFAINGFFRFLVHDDNTDAAVEWIVWIILVKQYR